MKNFWYKKPARFTGLFMLVILIFFHLSLSASGRTEPQASGGAVEIMWDNWGVPHIYAPDENAMFYAFGWVQMESNANAILRLYGEARCRAAEYWGEQYAESDRYLRTLRLPELAFVLVKEQKQDFKSFLESFARGINDYAASHMDEIEPELRQVLPVTVEDQFAHAIRLVHITFLAMNDNKNAEEWKLTGSNGWAVAPSRSAGGNAMLLMNPHLGWSDFFRWYEAHLSCPGFNAYGIAFIGLPVLKIAFNDNLGWTYTVNTIDACDLYELKLKDGGYIFDCKVREFERKKDTFKIKQADGTLKEQPLNLLSSIHGPVVAVKGDRALAIRMASLDQFGFLQQQYDMAKAADRTQFEASVKRLQVPMFNTLYADREGHISYLFGGRIPARKTGDFAYWQGIIDGTTSDTLWTDTLPFEDLPYVVDPDTGWLQNANDPPWFCTYPSPLNPDKFKPYISPRELPFRPQKSIKLLMSDNKISFDEMFNLISSTRLELADRLLDDLGDAVMACGSGDTLAAMKVLGAWDRCTNTDSKGAALFINWILEMGKEYFAKPWDEKQPITTPDGLKDQKAAVEALGRAAVKTMEAFGSLDEEWGKENRLILADKNYPGIGCSGYYGVFNVIRYIAGESGPAYAVAGTTSCIVVEFSNPPKAKGIMVYGNSSNKNSKHYGDQLQLFSNKQYRDIYFSKDDVAAHIEKKEMIRIDKNRD